MRYQASSRASAWLGEDGVALDIPTGAAGEAGVEHELGLISCITLACPLRDPEARAWKEEDDSDSDSDGSSDSSDSDSDGDSASSEEFGDPDELQSSASGTADASSAGVACESFLLAHSSTAIHLLDPRPSRTQAAGVVEWHADLGVIRDVAVTPAPALAFCVQAGAHHGAEAVKEAAGMLGGGVVFVLHGEPRSPPRVSRIAQLPWQ